MQVEAGTLWEMRRAVNRAEAILQRVQAKRQDPSLTETRQELVAVTRMLTEMLAGWHPGLPGLETGVGNGHETQGSGPRAETGA